MTDKRRKKFSVFSGQFSGVGWRFLTRGDTESTRHSVWESVLAGDSELLPSPITQPLDLPGNFVDIGVVKPTVKKLEPTTGTKFASEARTACNKLSDDARMSLTAAAMRMIYHNKKGIEETFAHRR